MCSMQLWTADIVSNVLGKLGEGLEAMKIFQNLGHGAGNRTNILTIAGTDAPKSCE